MTQMPPLFWIADNDLTQTLHASTWLDTAMHLMSFGWDVHLFSPGERNEKTEARGVPIVTISKPDIYFIQQLIFHWRVFRWLLGSQHSNGILLFNDMSALWCRIFQIYVRLFTGRQFEFVMDTRTLAMEPEERLSLRARARRAYAAWAEKRANAWFDGRTVITQAMAESLGIPDDLVWAIWSSGVNPGMFQQAIHERQFPQADDQPIELIYIGCLHVERNLMNLCRAVSLANQQQVRFHLTLVGEGNEEKELKAFADQHPESVYFHESVPQATIPRWLAKAQVGVLPFPDEEKFRVSSPIKLFEYLAAGLTIYASRIRCHTDVLRDDGVVFWVDDTSAQGLAEGLEQIVLMRGKLPELSIHAAEAALLHTWEQSARALSNGLTQHSRLAREKV